MRPDLHQRAQDTRAPHRAGERDHVHLPQQHARLRDRFCVAVQQHRLRALLSKRVQIRLVVLHGFDPVVRGDEHERVDGRILGDKAEGERRRGLRSTADIDRV